MKRIVFFFFSKWHFIFWRLSSFFFSFFFGRIKNFLWDSFTAFLRFPSGKVSTVFFNDFPTSCTAFTNRKSRSPLNGKFPWFFLSRKILWREKSIQRNQRTGKIKIIILAQRQHLYIHDINSREIFYSAENVECWSVGKKW